MPHLAPLVLIALALGDSPPQATPPPTPIDVVTAMETVLADAISRAEPSVVAIARQKKGKGDETTAVRGHPSMAVPPPQPNQFRFVGGIEEVEATDYIVLDYGSGVIIGDRGVILTTFGVVKGASTLLVRAAGRIAFWAEVIAADPRSDLAVIAPCEFPGLAGDPLGRPWLSKLRPIVLGDSSGLRKGNFLLALGNPFNAARDGRPSASWGILSNVARKLDSELVQAEPNQRQLRHYPTLLQLDAKLNLGMSGGAVINLKGELVGLTTNAANAGGFDASAGYALPIDPMNRRAIDALKQGKEVEYGFLGVNLSDLGSSQIASANPGTPAGEAGLLSGDEVVSIGGIPVVDADTLVLGVNRFSPGLPVPIQIRRDDRVIERTVTLSKLPIQGEVIATVRPDWWRGLRVDFSSTNPNSIQGRDVLEALAKGGIVVSEIRPGGPAEEAGLKVGQIIVEVDGTRVRNPADFVRLTARKKGPITLTTEGNRTVLVK